MLIQNARNYDLEKGAERTRSNRDLVDLFMMVQDRTRPVVTLEIGAFEAGFSKEIRRRNPAVRAIAFEANPHNYKNISSQPIIQKLGVEYRHLAVSGASGSIEFMLQRKVGGE